MDWADMPSMLFAMWRTSFQITPFMSLRPETKLADAVLDALSVLLFFAASMLFGLLGNAPPDSSGRVWLTDQLAFILAGLKRSLI